MKKKLNYRVTQSADQLDAAQRGVESDLRTIAGLLGSRGIVSADVKDVDNDLAALAIVVDTTGQTFGLRAGTLLFGNGEALVVGTGEVAGQGADMLSTDTQVVRLQYGEAPAGDPVENPYYAFKAQPALDRSAPADMLVVETLASYVGQPQSVKDLSVVLGSLSVVAGSLVADNTRQTLSFARPWFSAVDTQHRSHVGTGAVTSTNPHGTSPTDLTVGDYTLWQVFGGLPNVVLSKPTATGRIPGRLCHETIPAGNFRLDSTGRVTGKAGALYSPLGFWPERLLLATLSAGGQEVSAWIPRSRNVVAVWDPGFFAVAHDLSCYYSVVDGAGLPSVIQGTTLTLTQPTAHELVVCGGVPMTSLSEPKVSFSEVGLIPMSFAVRVNNQGKAYKLPDCIFCNTKLDDMGASPVTLTILPEVATRLRIAISNYNPGMGQVTVQVSGTDEAGVALSEQISFVGPLPTVSVGYVETLYQRQFTAGVFSPAGIQVQVLVRDNDGPNTTLTVFAEGTPDRPGQQDDLLVGTVFWNGGSLSADYSLDANIVLDRRLVETSGGARGLGACGWGLAYNNGINELNGAVGPAVPFATVLEDFSDPMWLRVPGTDALLGGRPVGLPSDSLGMRHDYQSRKIPFANTITNPTRVSMCLVPVSHRVFPNFMADYVVSATFHHGAGATVLAGTMQTNPFGPAVVSFPSLVPGSYHAVTLAIHGTGAGNLAALPDLFGGFVLRVG